MTDGPFKSPKLASCWNRFNEAVQNDATARAECCVLACDAIVQELLADDATGDLLSKIGTYASQDQLDLDPLASVESIFDGHPKTPFANTLQKELIFRLGSHLPVDAAYKVALEASVHEHIRETQNQFGDDFVRARDDSKMNQEQYVRAVEKTNASLDAADRLGICDALRAGNKNAFKEAARQKQGLDDGPKK